MADFRRWMVSYHDADTHEFLWQDEDKPAPLKVGDGVLLPVAQYRRFRVVDIWHSYDRHGHFDAGTHVFLVDVSGASEDRLQAMAPRYFSVPQPGEPASEPLQSPRRWEL